VLRDTDADLLSVRNLSKSFGKVRAVFDLSFGVDRGEILGIIGPNGAGKTTVFNLITGDIRPDLGKVIFDGKDMTFDPVYQKCRQGIARTYQIPKPFLNMTVLENLLVGSIYGGGKGYKQSKEKCEEILEKTGLLARRNVIAGFLPLFDRKRLELARALSTDPVLLLVDEVAGGLVEREVEEILKIIHSVRKDGITILWVEHIIMAMQRGPDRLLVMNFGRELFSGKPEEAFSSEEVQRVYMGSEEED
jgi:branched-chain amino acid transport system ATP-binding protein